MRRRKNYSNVLAIALVVIATYSGSAFATDIPNKYSGSEYTYSGLGTLKDDNGQTIDKFYQWEKDTTFDFYKLKQTSNSSIADIITKEIDDRSYGGDGDVIPGWTYDSKKMNGVVFSGIGDTAITCLQLGKQVMAKWMKLMPSILTIIVVPFQWVEQSQII